MKKILSLIMATACCSTIALGSGKAPVMFDGQQDTTSFVAFSKIDKDRLVGAASIVTGEQLSHSYSSSVSTALSNLSLGFYNTGTNIRGTDAALIIIDGMRDRDISSVTVDEVENVYILRDATAKMLYGSRAADGVIVIETKRADKSKDYKYMKANGEYGLQMVQYIPEYLDSYQYALAYNQARANDGLGATYSDEDLAGYLAVVNGDPDADYLRYPNNDMYDIFMNDSRSYYRANVEVGGHDQKVGYYVNVGYYGDTNLQKVGQQQEYNRINVRSNVDYEINDIISVYADLTGRWEMTDGSTWENADYITALSTHLPNAYPIFVGDWGDTYALGASTLFDTENLWGELARAGYYDTDVLFAQANMGLNFNLDKVTKGLSGKIGASYDAYSTLTKGQEYTYYRYAVQSDGSLVRTDGPDSVAGEESNIDDSIYRNVQMTSILNYDRTFGKHSFLGTAVFEIQSQMDQILDDSIDESQDDNSANAGLRVNYAYDGRYVLELDGTLLGSSKFTKANRWKAFGGFGGAWNVHKEAFMADVKLINRLKLKASYGKMGYDYGDNFTYMLYETIYDNDGYNFLSGPLGAGGWNPGWFPYQIANTEITYATAEEMNFGFEMNMFDNRLMMEANYFREKHMGIPAQVSSIYPGYMGFGSTTPMVNYNSTFSQGYEIGVSWGDQVGDFRYRVGASLLYTEKRYDIYEQDPWEYDHLEVAGRYTDAITGLIADGLYTSWDDISSYGVTSSYTTFQPGDIKYVDYISDGIIDSNDVVVIGNSAPRYTYSFNLNASYKGLSLYALGQGVADYDINIRNSSMMTSTGTNKYSAFVLGAAVYDESTGSIQSDATYPRLTTSTSNLNSYRNSTYWLRDGGYFRLKTVQLTYELPQKWSSKIKSQGIELYVKGENLFTVSKLKSEYGMDPISINAGLTSNPTFTTVAMGFNIIF